MKSRSAHKYRKPGRDTPEQIQQCLNCPFPECVECFLRFSGPEEYAAHMENHKYPGWNAQERVWMPYDPKDVEAAVKGRISVAELARRSGRSYTAAYQFVIRRRAGIKERYK